MALPKIDIENELKTISTLRFSVKKVSQFKDLFYKAENTKRFK